VTAAPADEPVRCSSWARSVDLSPIATVGSYTEYLLVETPLPWPKDVGEIPALAELAAPGRRVQALVPASLSAGSSERSVTLHRAADADFAGYLRTSAAQGASLATTVAGLGSAAPAPGIDVLVCTHGRRDVCCGSLGTDLAIQLSALVPREGVHIRRTSHTGGHRFAPTFLVLPQGTGWAFASVELVYQVLDRSVPFSSVAGHYRGCAGLGGPPVQALEREVLCSVGWDLLDLPRSGRATGEVTADGGQIVQLSSGTDTWEAVASPGRTLPVPDCMRPLSQARKTETEWTVSGLRHLS
jgi:hypothetical protein